MTASIVTLDQIWQTLNAISDPEIPVVSLVELGIVRAVQVERETVIVTITPTFAGCPAMHHMREEIFEKSARSEWRRSKCAPRSIRRGPPNG